MIKLVGKFDLQSCSIPEGLCAVDFIWSCTNDSFRGTQHLIADDVDFCADEPLNLLEFARRMRAMAFKLASGDNFLWVESEGWHLDFEVIDGLVRVTEDFEHSITLRSIESPLPKPTLKAHVPLCELVRESQRYWLQIFHEATELCPSLGHNEHVLKWYGGLD